MDKRRAKILTALAVVCVLAGGAYVALAATGPGETTSDAAPKAGEVLANTDLMVRAVDPDNPRLNGRVYVLAGGELERPSEDLACERVYFAAGRGICMGVAASGVDYTATIFDSDLQAIHSLPLTGLPSRARVSADGRYGAMTVFVSGDAYLESSAAFSTRTYVVDMAGGEVLAQLEQFDASVDGKRFEASDFNYWGVTFDPRDSDRFFATLATGAHHYLVEGSVSGRTVKVLRDGVECPSLSPDGTRIAFKSRVGEGDDWRVRVLDVGTLEDHAVAEDRSVDDQVEWLGDMTLAYSDETNVYTVPADGSGEERLLVRDATSPVRLPNR